MPQVDHIHQDLQAVLSKWRLIRDCLAGQEAVKASRELYLPKPNAADTSEENTARYDAYLARGVFYNVARRTATGLVGQIFASDPTVDIPAQLEPMRDNTDGRGVDLQQLAKRFTRTVLSYGRAGAFLDFPNSSEPATREQLLSGERKPTLSFYDPSAIINWRLRIHDNHSVLSLVVLQETYTKSDDGFKEEVDYQWRVLTLDENQKYKVEVYRKSGAGFVVVEGPFYPTDSSGNQLTFIPFKFIGSQDNSPSMDDAPLYDLCALNIAHYRNSCDYEDSCFIVGQPTPWFAGLTQTWVDEVLKGRIELGARAAVPLPENGSAGLLQAEPNSMPKEAMEHKERQMVALGAKLVEQRITERTLGEASMDQATDSSALAVVAKNVGDAMTQLLRWAAEFYYGLGGVDKIFMVLSTDFAINKMSAPERAQLLAEWQANAISDSEYRDQLKQSGVATLEDDKWKDEVESSPFKTPELDPLNDDDPAGGNGGGEE